MAGWPTRAGHAANGGLLHGFRRWRKVIPAGPLVWEGRQVGAGQHSPSGSEGVHLGQDVRGGVLYPAKVFLQPRHQRQEFAIGVDEEYPRPPAHV